MEIIGSMTDRVGKFCNCFQIVYNNSNWLLATCCWQDRANYLVAALYF